MNQQRIIFDSPSGYIILCVVIAAGIAYLLYRGSHPWSDMWNKILLAARFILLFFLTFLLLGPIVKQITNIFEKPVFVLMYDNSASIRQTTDTTTRVQLEQKINGLSETLTEAGYDVKISDLQGAAVTQPQFRGSYSDLGGALKRISSQYESSQIGGVLLASDGIYNEGVSPLYNVYNYPVYTLGVGDTTQHPDILIRDVAYNKIVYQGNKFPVRVEVLTRNLAEVPVNVSLMRRGKVLAQQTKNAAGDALLSFDFQPLADEQGMQKLDIKVDVKPDEVNVQNNKASVFVEVVEGKKKILVVASSPHPDIKALREVVDKNPNYEFLLHIPGVETLTPQQLDPQQIDLAVFHQAPDTKGKTRDLFRQFAISKTPLFLIVGSQTDLSQVAKQNMPVAFESAPRDYDEVIPGTNPGFSQFSISSESNAIIPNYPPVSVPFGKIRTPGSATPVLFQKVGAVLTEKPLLYIDDQDHRKIAVMLGEGLWRWKLNEYDRFENSSAFDEVFSKLIQYLSTGEDKRKFRCYPVKQEFSDTEPVVFESQVYNDIFEPVYGNVINIELTSDTGKKSRYNYTTSAGNTRYQIGGLSEGVYRYAATTKLAGKDERVTGEFAVIARQAELQNLTADFDLLKKISSNTGGQFYPLSKADELKTSLQTKKAKSVIHSEESYSSLVNLKWVFFLLLALVSLEWFARKFFGSY
ncbi:VWA domain-containing protein [Chryseolinea sp. T2]|uniref:VWA domain-containing protein n=1 Tax=Chryseolinea sp. T2 TaxID=3129255 RepID=UPI00307698A4